MAGPQFVSGAPKHCRDHFRFFNDAHFPPVAASHVPSAVAQPGRGQARALSPNQHLGIFLMLPHNSMMLLLPEEKVTNYKMAVTHSRQEISSSVASLLRTDTDFSQL